MQKTPVCFGKGLASCQKETFQREVLFALNGMKH